MSKLKNEILVAQKSIQSPEVAPTHLPDIFLAESCTGILDSEIIRQFSIFIKNNLPSATSSYASSIKFQHSSSTSEHESKPLLLMFKSSRIAYPFKAFVPLSSDSISKLWKMWQGHRRSLKLVEPAVAGITSNKITAPIIKTLCSHVPRCTYHQIGVIFGGDGRPD